MANISTGYSNWGEIMDAIKVIFFDMGNTVLHFHYGKSDDEKDRQGLILLTEYLNKLNSDIQFEDVKIGFYEKWMEGIKDRRVKFVEYPIETYLNNFLEKYNLSLSLDQCIEAINIFYTDYREQVYFEDNILDTFKRIKNKGYKIGVISNTCYYDEVMKECFKRAKIFDLIDNFAFSYSLRIGKPNKQIFKHAIDIMKITPEEAIMVGDSLELDIKPALDIGMKAVWLNPNRNKTNNGAEANFEISFLSEIHKYI